MKKEQLMQRIQEKFDEFDSILIEELDEIFMEENEAKRNQALLRAINDKDLKIDLGKSMDEVIKDLAIRITHYIFRNGSIEDFHAGKYNFEDFENIPPNTAAEEISQLTQANMKTLNKELVDKIGFLLKLFSNANYAHLNIAIMDDIHYDKDWDYPEIEKVEAEHMKYVWLVTGADKYLKK